MTEPIQLDTAKRLQTVLAYAKRGWFVFPCHEINQAGNCSCPRGPDCGSPGKHPRTDHGFKNATIEPDAIRKWHARWPSANWAIDCGRSRLAVVDVDPRNGGDDTLADLEKRHAELPQTVRACTGGGGQHYLYAFPDTLTPEGQPDVVPSSVLGQGIDLKAMGGYVIAAPSSHVSGRSYAWDSGGHPRDTAVATLPAWIRALAGSRGTEQYEQGGAVAEGYLGAAFEAAGWLGRSLGHDKAAARCPWEDEHSAGTRYDSSTIIFAPTKGYRVGWFWCSHSHCQRRRSLKDILAQLPGPARSRARELLKLDEQYSPETEEARRSEPATIEESPDQDWTRLLRRNQEGQITKDAGNAALILANLDDWRGCLEYDEFADRVRWARPVPDLTGLAAPAPGDDLSDHHVLYVHHWLAKKRRVAFAKQAIQDALEAAAKRNVRHPVRDYLQSLAWDHVPRASTWLHRYLGAPDEPYVHATGRWWLISAVARVLNPGCQADHLLVLEGEQGAGKSTAARILGGDFFLASLPDITSKDAAAVLQGHWIVEIGELDAFRGAAGTRVKDWVTRTVDSYRPAYGRFTVRRARQCVFIGTTNEGNYLADATGGRRFWPVRCRGLDREALTADRAQIWAEAKHYYDMGEEYHPSAELLPAIVEAQEDRYVGDEWERRIAEWVGERDGVSVGDVLAGAINLEPAKWDKSAQTRAGICLKRIGLYPRQRRIDGIKVRRYERP